MQFVKIKIIDKIKIKSKEIKQILMLIPAAKGRVGIISEFERNP